jgi:putative Mn2+ efflux pump MntP
VGFSELCLLAIGLSVDVAVISVGAGALARLTARKAFGIALLLTAFHAGMPVLGWWFGSVFADTASAYGNLIGFLLMFLVGLKMLKDAVTPEDTAHERDILRLTSLLLLAFAASIDAFIMGL